MEHTRSRAAELRRAYRLVVDVCLSRVENWRKYCVPSQCSLRIERSRKRAIMTILWTNNSFQVHLFFPPVAASLPLSVQRTLRLSGFQLIYCVIFISLVIYGALSSVIASFLIFYMPKTLKDYQVRNFESLIYSFILFLMKQKLVLRYSPNNTRTNPKNHKIQQLPKTKFKEHVLSRLLWLPTFHNSSRCALPFGCFSQPPHYNELQ